MSITLDELGRRIDSVQNSITDIQSKQLTFYDKITGQITGLVEKIARMDVLEVKIEHVVNTATECRTKNYAEHTKLFDMISDINVDVADVSASAPSRDEVEHKDDKVLALSDKVVSKTEKIITQVWEVVKLILAVFLAMKVAKL